MGPVYRISLRKSPQYKKHAHFVITSNSGVLPQSILNQDCRAKNFTMWSVYLTNGTNFHRIKSSGEEIVTPPPLPYSFSSNILNLAI
jgi:hypothetical protein